jgi:hypothetical protein
MLDFKFDKAFYKESELLRVCPIPRSTFHKWQSEWMSKGLNPEAMGKILVKGTSTVFWNGPKFLKWLQENKLDQECKYDYEAADKKIATSAIFVMIKKAEELIK